MTLQTAKNKMIKSIRVAEMALRCNLKSNFNHLAITKRDCVSKLSMQDQSKFLEWCSININPKHL